VCTIKPLFATVLPFIIAFLIFYPCSMPTAVMTESGDSLSVAPDHFVRRQSSPILPSTVFSNFNAPVSTSRPIIISPPPTPRSPKPRAGKLSLRLRSNSGLSLHTNEDALRRYTDYNPDGSPRTPLFAPVIWHPETANGIDRLSAQHRRSTALTPQSPSALPIPDLFGQDVFHMVLKNPTTAHRLWKFAQKQGCGESIEYLMKVGTVTHAATHAY
jgi:hypothetical protein